MRVIFVLTALLVASIPSYPVPLSLEAPQILVQNFDCAAAERQAQALAATLGFAEARMKCGRGTLDGHVPARFTLPANMITYDVFTRRSLAQQQLDTSFSVPGNVPFVASGGDVVAYVKLDALVLRLRPERLLETAFALEEAGIPRSDMISRGIDGSDLIVRVRPISAAQVMKIERVAGKHQSDPLAAPKFGFIQDCDAAIAALGPLALSEAQHRAQVMARTAGVHVGSILGVIDTGGRSVDAICGLGNNATMQQLSLAAQNAQFPEAQNGSRLYATFVRSVRAAWRLQVPENPQGSPWQQNPDSRFGSRVANRPAFISDGVPVAGEAFLPNSVQPNRLSVAVPAWSYRALLQSPYAKFVTYLDFGFGVLQQGIVIESHSASTLQKEAADFQSYFASLARRSGKSADLSFGYSQTNCRPAIDAAIFRATQDALSRLQGKRIRYLESGPTDAIGNVSCAYDPTVSDDWSKTVELQSAASAATVRTAY